MATMLTLFQSGYFMDKEVFSSHLFYKTLTKKLLVSVVTSIYFANTRGTSLKTKLTQKGDKEHCKTKITSSQIAVPKTNTLSICKIDLAGFFFSAVHHFQTVLILVIVGMTVCQPHYKVEQNVTSGAFIILTVHKRKLRL